MDSHKDLTEPDQDTNYQAFFKWGIVWNFQRETLLYIHGECVNAEKWGAKIRTLGDANLLSPNLHVLPALSSQLLVFLRLCIMNTFFAFPHFAMSVMP